MLRIKEFQLFDEAFVLDALKDTITIDESWVVLFPRIDTEFDDHQLHKLFSKFHSLGVVHICFIPAELLNIRILLAEFKILINSVLTKRPRVFCGYARSLYLFKKIWSPYYKLEKKYKAGKQIFFLKAN